MNGISLCPESKFCNNLIGGFECRCPIGTDAHEITGECQGWYTFSYTKSANIHIILYLVYSPYQKHYVWKNSRIDQYKRGNFVAIVLVYIYSIYNVLSKSFFCDTQ